MFSSQEMNKFHTNNFVAMGQKIEKNMLPKGTTKRVGGWVLFVQRRTEEAWEGLGFRVQGWIGKP